MLPSLRSPLGSWSTANPSRHADGVRGARRIDVDRRRRRTGERRHVVRPAGLRPAADRRALPPAERLAADDRTGDVPVDVGVADLDPAQPAIDLVLVERVDPAGEPERRRVLQLDRVVEVVGAHHAEHRAEALGLVEPRPRPHAEAHARRPQPAGRRPADAGWSSHDSPASSSVSPRRSTSPGGSISGPIVVAGSVGQPTRRVRTAAREPAQEPAVVVHRAVRISRLAAEHF